MTPKEAAELRRLHHAAVNAQVELHDAYADVTASEDERDEALDDSGAAEAAFDAKVSELTDAPVGPPTDKRMSEIDL